MSPSFMIQCKEPIYSVRYEHDPCITEAKEILKTFLISSLNFSDGLVLKHNFLRFKG